MLRAYGDAAAPKLADLARMAGIAPATAQDSLAAEAFIDWVDRMNEATGIPKYVSGIRRSDIPQMAVHADAEANSVPRSAFDGPPGARAYVRGRRGWYV